MQNYKLIADRAVIIIGSVDPSQYKAAYDVMVAEIASVPVTGIINVNEAIILAGMGLNSGAVFIDKLTVALHPSVIRLLQRDGVDVIHTESKAAMSAMLAGNVITQSEYDWVASFYTRTDPVWPDLKPGHVQNALQQRQIGAV